MSVCLSGRLRYRHCHGHIPPGCDNDWSTWWLGSRTQWNVTKDFYLGVDVMYSKLFERIGLPEQYDRNAIYESAVATARLSDVDNWQFRFRVHRDFYP